MRLAEERIAWRSKTIRVATIPMKRTVTPELPPVTIESCSHGMTYEYEVCGLSFEVCQEPSRAPQWEHVHSCSVMLASRRRYNIRIAQHNSSKEFQHYSTQLSIIPHCTVSSFALSFDHSRI